MPTVKPRVTFTITENELQQISNYQHGRKLKNQSQAILSLIRMGLAQLEDFGEPYQGLERVNLVEQQLLKRFRDFNEEGQEKVCAYVSDLTDSGKYIKTNKSEMGLKQA